MTDSTKSPAQGSTRAARLNALPWVALALGAPLLFLAPRVPVLASLGVLLAGVGLSVWRFGWRAGIGMLVAVYALFILGWAPYFLGGLATKRRFRYQDTENAGLTPKSFQLPFEDVAFEASDGVALKGWWVPAPENRGTVILVHGLNRSRIEMVRKVPFLHSLGWNALLFDLRHHGESAGDTTTFGYFEKNDVKGATAFVRHRSTAPVALWGVSLGAATVMLEAADDPSISAVVCDSSYLSLRDTVHHHLVLFKHFAVWLRLVPVWPVADEAIFWMGERGDFPPDAIDIQGAAARVSGRPVLFVACSGDRRMPKEIAFKLQEAGGKNAEVLVVPGESHGGAYRDGTAAYQNAVTHVLELAREKAPLESARANLE
jgi:fermentation-respiration switch protein FrsA (DUF1100 family)